MFGNLIAVQVVVGTLNPVEDPLLYVSYRQLRHFRIGKNEKRLSAVRQLIRLPDIQADSSDGAQQFLNVIRVKVPDRGNDPGFRDTRRGQFFGTKPA